MLTDNFGMAEKVVPNFKGPGKARRRLFLKEWRKYRDLTQEQLAERAGMATSNISQLERGLQGYSEEGLEQLAEALNCEPAHLLMVDPTKDDAIWSIWERAKPGERERIIDVARALVKTAIGRN